MDFKFIFHFFYLLFAFTFFFPYIFLQISWEFDNIFIFYFENKMLPHKRVENN